MTPHRLLDIVLHLKQSQLSAVQCVENALFENHLLQANLVAFKLIALKTFKTCILVILLEYLLYE